MGLASFAVALLAGMGMGSGGLFVVYLTLICNIPQITAQELNLYFFMFSNAAALTVHNRYTKLDYRKLFVICAVGAVGCIIGAVMANRTDVHILRRIFAVVLILSGAVSLIRSPAKQKNAEFKAENK